MTDATAAAQRQAARAYGNAIAAQPMGCFGCAWSILGLILVVWLLTHISEVWNLLDRIVR